MRSIKLLDFFVNVYYFLLKNKLLVIVIIVGSFLRLFQLSNNPPSVFTDELNPWVGTYDYLIGYGPFYTQNKPLISILQGVLFGQFASLYLLGPSTLAIRLPGAIYGIALIPMTYILTKRLFGEKIALLSAFLLSISPEGVLSSRVFYMQQTYDSVLFITLAVYLYITGVLNKKFSSTRILLSIILFNVIIFGYFNAKGPFEAYVLLSFLTFLAVLQLKGSIGNKFKILYVILVPLVTYTFFSLIVDPILFKGSTPVTGLFYSSANIFIMKGIYAFYPFLIRYIEYFNPVFLFIQGGPNPSTGVQVSGVLLYPSLLFFYLGICVTIYESIFKRGKKGPYLLVLIWILITPIQAAAYLYAYTPSNESVEFFNPMAEVVCALGVFQLYAIINKKKNLFVKKARVLSCYRSHKPHIIAFKNFLITIIVIYLVSNAVFSVDYFEVHPAQTVNNPNTQWGWMYGFPEIAEYINHNNLTQNDIYVNPNGLFDNNITLFNYYYSVQKTPLNFLNYYSHGKITKIILVSNLQFFYSNSSSLLITGDPQDAIMELQKDGYTKVNILINITRPDGNIAVSLLKILPGVGQRFKNLIKNNTLASIANVSKPTEWSNANLTTINDTFSISAIFSVPVYNITNQSRFLIFSQQSAALEFWSESYFGSSFSNNSLVPVVQLDSNNSNHSLAGTFAFFEYHQVLERGKRYMITLSFNNSNTGEVFLNTNFIGYISLNYPIHKFASTSIVDSGPCSFFIKNINIYDFPLTIGEISYLYSSNK